MTAKKLHLTGILLLLSILFTAFHLTGCGNAEALPQPDLSKSSSALPEAALTAEKTDSNEEVVYTRKNRDRSTVYSIDNGETWISQSDYEKLYPPCDIEWWTYDEYAGYIEQQKIILQQMADEHIEAYTERQGTFIWTQELADETIQKYEKNLQDIKNGIKISKTIEGLDDGCEYIYYSLDPITPPSSTIEIVLPDGTTKKFSGKDKSSVYDEAKNFCEQQVLAGQLSQDQKDKILDNLK